MTILITLSLLIVAMGIFVIFALCFMAKKPTPSHYEDDNKFGNKNKNK